MSVGHAPPTGTGEADRLLGPLVAAAGGASAVAVAAHRGGRRLLAAAGTTAHGGGPAADPHTPFEIGSVTKTFTALLLADMAARGEVGYDDPVDRHLPPGAAPRARGGPVTLLHLATHTSGLRRLPPGLLRSAAPRWYSNPYERFGTADLLTSLPRARPFARPGERMRYSNFGVALLGLALARAAGSDYAELLTGRVLAPLGLTGTGCTDGPERATGYWRGRARPGWRIPGLAAAGALRSSARDLLRYLEAHLAPGTAAPGNGALRTALTEVTRPRLVTPPGRDRICLVWNARPRPGHDLYFHSGGTRGCTTFVGFSPQRDVAFAALANTSPTLRGAFVQRAYLTLRALAAGP
ncbi:serine hydrolase domain-containing protein [Streptomyces johnsoniae]|uniref:Serine hydrolase domain-containing protein n=1 Tax=Streptomyces johnsoniae TaxID=3075532 RepID=A0ABU2S116_9ACTN|nr:serine hydrolase domain-containing protein [Streptomyces sp. DSM 41886]MDT0442597.1 serine hydrolase domain-containing protein [Streptomyces sp. DSM 41886]